MLVRSEFKDQAVCDLETPSLAVGKMRRKLRPAIAYEGIVSWARCNQQYDTTGSDLHSVI